MESNFSKLNDFSMSKVHTNENKPNFEIMDRVRNKNAWVPGHNAQFGL